MVYDMIHDAPYSVYGSSVWCVTCESQLDRSGSAHLNEVSVELLSSQGVRTAFRSKTINYS